MASNNGNNKRRKKLVTSTYADLYLEDDYCDFKNPFNPEKPVCTPIQEQSRKATWRSPSDYIIDLVDSLPPYTSRVLRSKTHYGILAQGENLIQEHDTFYNDLDKLIKDNEAACQNILEYQIKLVKNKVKREKAIILAKKNKIFVSEISKFYEDSLQQLEDHVRSELKIVLVDLQANIKKDCNTMISNKLKIEKDKLDTILKEKVMYEVHRIKNYYQLLLKYVLHLNTKLKNQALIESNDTLRSFVRQMDVENITNTMYVLCQERKKCKIRQFLLQNDQMSEITDIKNKLKHRLDILEDWKKWDTGVCSTKCWEEKIRKIMQLFLKFIGFSLKLLPEQVTFLMDLEKMVILQLNEVQKSSFTAPSILVENDNIFNFEKTEPVKIQCDEKPFEIIGDLSDDVPPKYSSETIPSNVDLPFIRVGRKFIYAKCENFEEVKAFLEIQPCKCQPKHENEFINEEGLAETIICQEKIEDKQQSLSQNHSSFEHLPLDDIRRLENCHVKKCNLRKQKPGYSDIDTFINFTEENFEKLKKVTSKLQTSSKVRKKINPANIVFNEVPFAKTKERVRNIDTQYSSQETFEKETIGNFCPCDDGFAPPKASTSDTTKTKSISSIMNDRKMMLSNLVHDHPRLLNIVFTEESYDLPF